MGPSWPKVTPMLLAGGLPSCSVTVSMTHFSRRATSVSAANGRTADDVGIGSPTRRLNSVATRSGSETARRRAVSPVSSSPSSLCRSTRRMAAPRFAELHHLGAPSRRTAAAVNVVPTSTPSQ